MMRQAARKRFALNALNNCSNRASQNGDLFAQSGVVVANGFWLTEAVTRL
jgi:hypothetical protein